MLTQGLVPGPLIPVHAHAGGQRHAQALQPRHHHRIEAIHCSTQATRQPFLRSCSSSHNCSTYKLPALMHPCAHHQSIHSQIPSCQVLTSVAWDVVQHNIHPGQQPPHFRACRPGKSWVLPTFLHRLQLHTLSFRSPCARFGDLRHSKVPLYYMKSICAQPHFMHLNHKCALITTCINAYLVFNVPTGQIIPHIHPPLPTSPRCSLPRPHTFS